MSRYVSYRDGGKTTEEGIFKWFLKFFSKGSSLANDTTTLQVTQNGGGADMSVDIAAGDAHIPYSTYSFYAWSDATENVSVTAADGTNERYDIVVAYIDLAVVSSATDNNLGALKFDIVDGTPAGSPADPSDSAIQTAVGASNPWIKLARVSVPAGVSSIVDAYITDLRDEIVFTGKIKTDTINENTAANGVTIDGLNIKDSKLTTSDSVVTANITDAAVTYAKLLSTIFSGQVSSAANAGTAGGTNYYINLGGIKLCWTRGALFTAGASTFTTKTVTLPTSFFSTVQHVSATLVVSSLGGGGAKVAYVQDGYSTTTVTIVYYNGVGSADSIRYDVLTIGT